MKTLAVLTLVLVTTAAAAQEKGKPIDVAVRQVNDRRTNGHFAHLAISLELPKVLASDVAASRVLIASALDDSGRDLRDPEANEPELELNQRGSLGADKAQPATVSVMLKNPERKALKLKEVRGEIELYMPSKDPNSVAEVAKFVGVTGKPLAHKALKANGVEIALISNAQIEAERKKRSEAKKKEYAEMGFEGEDLENMMKSFLESLFGLEENDLPVRIKDPNKRIQQIVYVDPAGEVKHISIRDMDGVTVLSTWAGKPQPDWKLRVSMTTPKNVVRYSFAVADVALP